jgi:hypothetical protein
MFIQHTAGSQTFSAIRQSFDKAGGGQHIAYSEMKGLHVRADASLGSFLAAFRNEEALDARATMRKGGVTQIKDAIDREFGANMGQRAFEHASRDGQMPAQLTKSDFRHLADAIERLRADDQAPANGRLGGDTIDELYDTAVRDGSLQADREIDETRKNELKNSMIREVANLPPGARPEECRRAAQMVLLKFDANCEFEKRFGKVAEADRAPQREKLSAHLASLESGALKGVPLHEAAFVLRESCKNLELGPDCDKGLKSLAAHWTQPEPKESWPKESWKKGSARPGNRGTIGSSRASTGASKVEQENERSSSDPVPAAASPKREDPANKTWMENRKKSMETLGLDFNDKTLTTPLVTKRFEELYRACEMYINDTSLSAEIRQESQKRLESYVAAINLFNEVPPVDA